jgi:hypothetical protein
MTSIIKNFFSGEKAINSFFLNLIGAQSVRYIITKSLYWIKINFFNTNKLLSLKYKKLIDDGLQIKENFLSEQEFNNIFLEYEKLINDKRFVVIEKQSVTEVERGIDLKYAYVSDKLKEDYPFLFNLKNNRDIRDFFEYAEQKKNINIQCRLERIEITSNELPDTNKDYHYDTYYNTFKCWLFIKDVESSMGPFRFVCKSHLFNLKRLFLEWINSVKYSINNSVNTSFRDSEINKKYNDSISQEITVKKNSLVMANTHGLHRRGDGVVGSVRFGIQFWTRENPFKIFK